MERKNEEIALSLFKYSFIDLFSPEGKYLLHCKMPDLGWEMTFDSKGFLYMLKEEEGYWRVVKYKVEFK